jgi:5-methyltetrahydropteroyltriglutamate--homocysteine methyltransferase
MPIPTEPIGSIPRPPQLLAAMTNRAAGRISDEQFHAAEESAVRETILRFEETGSPVVTDGEQTKPSFATTRLPDLQTSRPAELLFRSPTVIRANFQS